MILHTVLLYQEEVLGLPRFRWGYCKPCLSTIFLSVLIICRLYRVEVILVRPSPGGAISDMVLMIRLSQYNARTVGRNKGIKLTRTKEY